MRDWEDNDRNMFVNCSWSSVAVLHHRLSATPLKCDGPSLKLSGSVWRCGSLQRLTHSFWKRNVGRRKHLLDYFHLELLWVLVAAGHQYCICIFLLIYSYFLTFAQLHFPFLERVKQLWHEPSFCHCFQFRCSFYFVEFNLICLVVTFRFLSLSFFRPFTCI